MPNFYSRKGNTSRGSWTAEALQNAVDAVDNGVMGVNEAARNFGIPATTLKRRRKNKNFTKQNRLGPASALGETAEKKLVQHIKKLQKFGFSPTRDALRTMAYDLAEKMNIKHKFDRNSGKAGYVWLQKLLKRNPELSVRKSEGVSLARSQGMSREIVTPYFRLLERTLSENDLFDKSGNIYNMDETGMQLNNKPGYVIAAKGSKSVPAITSGEKGETISVIACCNAEGVFLPPYSIFKGKNKKEEFADGMPPGSAITMSQKSAYVNAAIFRDWLENHFVPRKMPGKVLLILDGHTSHTTSVEVLEFTEKNDIILLCFPSHTTHYLQPLDRAFFKSLKSNYNMACNNFIKTNPTRKLNRYQFGKLLGSAWNKSATVQNAVSAFRSTGIAPFNPDAVPDYAFLLGNDNVQPPELPSAPSTGSNRSLNSPQLSTFTDNFRSTTPPRSTPNKINSNLPTTPSSRNNSRVDSPQPSTSKENSSTHLTPNKITPGKLLDEVSPVPNISSVRTVRKRGRSVASILNSAENINNVKENQKKKMKGKKTVPNKQPKKEIIAKGKAPTKKKTVAKKKVGKREESDSNSDYESPILLESEDSDEDDNESVGCGEDYLKTRNLEDWIKCLICGRWTHEGCTKFTDLCDLCGKHAQK